MQWFLDLDDTLIVGPVTWAINTVLPTLMAKYSLSTTSEVLAAALLEGQEKASSGSGEAELLDLFFSRLGWPNALKQELVQEVFENYQPTLFADSLSFLKWLAEDRQNVYLLSNNNGATHIANQLGIAPYINGYFTPKLCGVEVGKPHRAVWDYVTAHQEVNDPVMIGDDPWSDGAFADAINVPCCIVDRLDRFGDLRKYHRVASLLDLKMWHGQRRPA